MILADSMDKLIAVDDVWGQATQAIKSQQSGRKNNDLYSLSGDLIAVEYVAEHTHKNPPQKNE